jgi:hypothetical protein
MRKALLGITGSIYIVFVGACSAAVPPLPTVTPRAVPTVAKIAPTATPIPGRPVVGQEAHLWARGLPQWHLAIDEDAMAAYVSITNAGDTAGLRQLIQQGRIFPVADETRVLVVAQKWPAIQVRVLEGPQSGQSGWVGFEHVR